jgi:hypothetical protein
MVLFYCRENRGGGSSYAPEVMVGWGWFKWVDVVQVVMAIKGNRSGGHDGPLFFQCMPTSKNRLHNPISRTQNRNMLLF